MLTKATIFLLTLKWMATLGSSTVFTTLVGETLHSNVRIENNEPFNPEMYAKKVVLRKFQGPILANTFSLLPELEELYIAASSIESIAPEAFSVLPKLKRLHLAYNELPPIKNEIFKNCKNLTEITIDHNKKLVTIESNAFSNLPKLESLVITKEHVPRHITKEFLHGSTKLKKILIHASNVTILDKDFLDGLDNLKFISFSENDITFITPETFHNRNLTHIYLPWNKLLRFTGTELKNLEKLAVLDISDNPIVKIDAEKIQENAPNLLDLHLINNQLSCEDKRWVLLTEVSSTFRVNMITSDLTPCAIKKNKQNKDMDHVNIRR